jgi:hypothetical protein
LSSVSSGRNFPKEDIYYNGAIKEKASQLLPR